MQKRRWKREFLLNFRFGFCCVILNFTKLNKISLFAVESV